MSPRESRTSLGKLKIISNQRSKQPVSNAKYVFITGGVTSSLGKGIVAASLGKLLQSRGYEVVIQKLDPYINVDPGTMNPYEHGECYVTGDGTETDLDLGHYERFLNIRTGRDNNITTGKIYHNVITNERKGKYLGKTVQVIPHITNEIKRNIYKLGRSATKPRIVITEIGGCVGDIESLPFIEAVRQVRLELGNINTLIIHLTLIPYLASSGELKTKPTQHSVKELQECGVQPDILVCRTQKNMGKEIKEKIGAFCNVPIRSVIESRDVNLIYEVPLMMSQERLDLQVLKLLCMKVKPHRAIRQWAAVVREIQNPEEEVEIGLVGKYVEFRDAYKSIAEAIVHAGPHHKCRAKIRWIHSDELGKRGCVSLSGLFGILVAPGFGGRGFEDKIKAVTFARENGIPFLGICLGLQCAMIEFARNVLNWKDAQSTEFSSKTTHPVVDLMSNQEKKRVNYGSTMRLGDYVCQLRKGTKAYEAYHSQRIRERHRHRYEINRRFLESFESNDFIASGTEVVSGLVEIMELKKHPWFIGTQFHPEYKSTVLNPHPLFIHFLGASLKHKLSA